MIKERIIQRGCTRQVNLFERRIVGLLTGEILLLSFERMKMRRNETKENTKRLCFLDQGEILLLLLVFPPSPSPLLLLSARLCCVAYVVRQSHASIESFPPFLVATLRHTEFRQVSIQPLELSIDTREMQPQNSLN